MIAATSHYASGDWRVADGKDGEFIAAWSDFLTWTRDAYPGLESAVLMREDHDPGHFVSVARWTDVEQRSAWNADPTMHERLAACVALCDDFHGGPFEEAVTVVGEIAASPRPETTAR